MNAQESYALAEIAFGALRAASPKPLDVLLILADGGDEIAASSQMLASMPSNEGEQLRIMLRHYCSALALIVERCTEPEELLKEITEVIRKEAIEIAAEPQP